MTAPGGIPNSEQEEDQTTMHSFHDSPPNNICWHRHSGCNCPDAVVSLVYGRVRSGKRWFWHVWGWKRHNFDEKYDDYGLADTEEVAIAAAKRSLYTLAAGRPAKAHVAHYGAAARLKEINREKRAARPASDSTEARPTEYLFAKHFWISDDGYNSTHHDIYAFPIVKKTAKRIYYKRKKIKWLPEIDAPDVSESARRDWSHDDHDIGFIDRQQFEVKGEAYNHGQSLVGLRFSSVCQAAGAT